jgi:hypothetical protein
MSNTDFSSVNESGSKLTSNLCAGSIGFWVLLSIGLCTLSYSQPCMVSDKLKWLLSSLFSLTGVSSDPAGPH